MGSLINVVLNAIKMRFVAITTRLRMWLNPSFIRTRVFGRIRTFFMDLFNVKPRHKDDYYPMFGYLVSKRLAFAVVIVVGTLSLCYLVITNADIFQRSKTGGLKTYSYKSIPLRFASGEVRITAEKGYLAYQGQVSKGGANGRGVLYNEDGTFVYEGYFENNRYEGAGKSYHKNGSTAYVGNFSNNLYEGLGKQYRENGTVLYNGEFVKGMKEGEGKLYGENSTPVYTGNFSSDRILFSELLDISASALAAQYTGSQITYMMDDELAVYMPEIDALYVGVRDEESLDDNVMVQTIYVRDNTFSLGGSICRSIPDVTSLLGEPEYEGNSVIVLPEAVMINTALEERGESLFAPVEMDEDQEFTEVHNVYGIESDYEVYLYAYRLNGLIYSFICPGRGDDFEFYSISSDQ